LIFRGRLPYQSLMFRSACSRCRHRPLRLAHARAEPVAERRSRWGRSATCSTARLGYVIDYVDVYWGAHHWPAFNVADSRITVVVALLVLDILRNPQMDESPKTAEIAASPAGHGD
jgi:hypothetical protein